MDDFTARLLAGQKEQGEHPELYQFQLICDNCGTRRIKWATKSEVALYRSQHSGSNELHMETCDKCNKRDDEDED